MRSAFLAAIITESIIVKRRPNTAPRDGKIALNHALHSERNRLLTDGVRLDYITLRFMSLYQLDGKGLVPDPFGKRMQCSHYPGTSFIGYANAIRHFVIGLLAQVLKPIVGLACKSYGLKAFVDLGILYTGS